jgi:serine/threonine protein kinase
MRATGAINMHVYVHRHYHQIPFFLFFEIRGCRLGFPPQSSASPGQPLDLSKRLEFAMDIARGMACLHAQRPIIIHRDLKTANLLVSARFEIKVADFGLSRIKDASHVRAHQGSGVARVFMLGCFFLSAVQTAGSTPDLSSLPHLKSVARGLFAAHGTSPLPAKNCHPNQTSNADFVAAASNSLRCCPQLQVSRAGLEGTIEYCAPEVLRGEPYTERCDVYSFGVVLWELLLRQRPYSDAEVPVFLLMVNIGNGTLSLPEVPVESATAGK